MMESNTEKVQRYLQDLHAAECGIEQMVLMHATNLRAPESVREACSKFVMDCRVRQQAIEDRLTQFGSTNSATKDWMDAIASQLTALWNAGHDNVERMTMDLVKLYASGHLLQGSYCALAGFADSIGDVQTKRLGERGIEESKEMAEAILPFVDRIARYAPVPI